MARRHPVASAIADEGLPPGYAPMYGSEGQWRRRGLKEGQRQFDERMKFDKNEGARLSREGSLERQYGRGQQESAQDYGREMEEERANAEKWASLIGGGAGLAGSLGGAFLGGPLGAMVLGGAGEEVGDEYADYIARKRRRE